MSERAHAGKHTQTLGKARAPVCGTPYASFPLLFRHCQSDGLRQQPGTFLFKAEHLSPRPADCKQRPRCCLLISGQPDWSMSNQRPQPGGTELSTSIAEEVKAAFVENPGPWSFLRERSLT